MVFSDNIMMAARHLGLVSPWNPFADDAYDIHMMPPTSAPTQYYDHPYAQYYDRSAAFSNSSSSSSSPGAPDDVYQVPWWYTVIFMIVFAAILCGSYCLRLACAKFCGWQMQDRHSRHPLARGSTSGMLRARSQAMAATEEIREVQLEKQRQERRLWYMFYLKAYTTVLTEEHFKCNEQKIDDDAKEMMELEEGKGGGEAPIQDTTEESGEKCDTVSVAEDPINEVDADLQDVDLSTSNNNEDSQPDSDDDKDDSEPDSDDDKDDSKPGNDYDKDDSFLPPRMMTLWDAHDTTPRCVEANCSICLGDYEAGDSVVQSAADQEDEYCIHVFHSECMLQWLSQGKKRCPICRHWFVPAVRIKQQMREAHVVTRPGSLHHLYDATSRQELASLGSTGDDTDSNMSGSSQGDEEHGSHDHVVNANVHGHHGHRHHGHHNSNQNNHNQQHESRQPNTNNTNTTNNNNSSPQSGRGDDNLGIDLELGVPGVAIEVPGW